MAVGNILGQAPEVKTVNNNEADVAGNVELNAQNTDFVSATAPVFKGDVDASSYRMKNVADPVEAKDAVNLNFFNENKIKIDLVWTNPNPTNEFGAKTINVDLSSYKMIFVVFTIWYQEPYRSTVFCLMDEKTKALSHDGEVLWYRNFSVTSSSIRFQAGQAQDQDVFATNNRGMVPYKIYGVKF